MKKLLLMCLALALASSAWAQRTQHVRVEAPNAEELAPFLEANGFAVVEGSEDVLEMDFDDVIRAVGFTQASGDRAGGRREDHADRDPLARLGNDAMFEDVPRSTG